VLRWADNPRHRLAASRAVQIVPHVGPATAARLLALLADARDAPDALLKVVPPAPARTAWEDLARCLAALARAPQPWPGDLARVIEWYAPHLERRHEDAAVRRLDLEQLLQIAVLYGTRQRFLTEMTLDPPEAVSDEAGAPSQDDDYLILSTIHSAKGQEWKAVTVLRVVDGCIPSDMACGSEAEIEEERRLLYVAMTRARDELELVVPQRFYVHNQPGYGDKHVYALRSRFIPVALLKLFDECVWPMPAGAPDGTQAQAREGPGIDLAARVRAQWRGR
jgi:DNA helicase-2/ATP-dependent DNA helicase PcrA